MKRHQKILRSIATLAAAASVLTVAACSSPVGQGISQSTSSLADRLRGGGTQTSDASQTTAVGVGVGLQQRRDCPIAELREGTQTQRVYEEARQGDPQGVLYQGTINRVARDCVYGSDGSVSVRFGIAGRVVLGPLGLPGQRTVSIRAVLFNTETGPVWSELFPVSVDLGPGRQSQAFTFVQQTPATLIPPSDTSKYRVIIGFDEGAAPQQ
ncbi:MAG: hypothetical protein AAGD23_02710 [Pseudomonadota bacterium]